MSVWPPWYRNLMERSLGGRLFSSTRIDRLRSLAYSQGILRGRTKNPSHFPRRLVSWGPKAEMMTLRTDGRTDTVLAEQTTSRYLLYSTSTTRRSLRRAALPAPAVAMAAYAAALSTRPVRFDDVRAWSVTTTFAPAALHSSLSLHRTWQMPAVRYFVALLLQTNPTDLLTKKKKQRNCCRQLRRSKRRYYLVAGTAGDAAPVELGAGGGEEAAVEGRGEGAVPARTGCANSSSNQKIRSN